MRRNEGMGTQRRKGAKKDVLPVLFASLRLGVPFGMVARRRFR